LILVIGTLALAAFGCYHDNVPLILAAVLMVVLRDILAEIE